MIPSKGKGAGLVISAGGTAGNDANDDRNWVEPGAANRGTRGGATRNATGYLCRFAKCSYQYILGFEDIDNCDRGADDEQCTSSHSPSLCKFVKARIWSP